MDESQTYYENNLNIFTNGMSLMTVSAIESQGNLHQAEAQTFQMSKVAKNMEVHSNYWKSKTKDIIKNLKMIEKNHK
mgnify:CR=1 FL=1